MPSHVHLIFKSKTDEPGKTLGEMKKHTSKQLTALIKENATESRREWMLWMMERAGHKNSNVDKLQFWQQHNRPIELWSPEVTDQKADYIHNNPVEAGFVLEPWHWKYSSAIDYYTNEHGLLKIEHL